MRSLTGRGRDENLGLGPYSLTPPPRPGSTPRRRRPPRVRPDRLPRDGVGPGKSVLAACKTLGIRQHPGMPQALAPWLPSKSL